MAWDDFERDGQQLWTGDESIDELVLALRRIADAYEQKFLRLPYVDEVLLSLERVFSASPERFLEDPGGMEQARIHCIRTDSKPRQRVDFNEFEGFKVLDSSLREEVAIRLIKRVLLREFAGSCYADKADVIEVINLDTGQRQGMSYDESS